jgi:rRNA maturation endonuclease Nob1
MPANEHLSGMQFSDDTSPHVECDHCGRIVPFAETSEGMCDSCGDRPISDAVRELNRRRN